MLFAVPTIKLWVSNVRVKVRVVDLLKWSMYNDTGFNKARAFAKHLYLSYVFFFYIRKGKNTELAQWCRFNFTFLAFTQKLLPAYVDHVLRY